MSRNRFDETWHRLREWTKEQASSERLAAQILRYDGFTNIDPSHPLGGRDGGKDAVAQRDEKRFVMASFFPRGQQDFKAIREKFLADLDGARANRADGIAFVTNQELRLGERRELVELAGSAVAEIYHLERITHILDAPEMTTVRKQFLDIDWDDGSRVNLGGQGGLAPGAGGGGGGAIGEGARGGPGGAGGNIHIEGGDGTAPGAGGGGAGAIGPGAVGGEGGGGGEYVSEVIDFASDPELHHIELRVGRGGDGPGEDTIVNLCDESGRVLRSIVAKGGKMGAPAYVPPVSRPPSANEVSAGLRVTSIIVADVVHWRDGLWSILCGGIDWFSFGTSRFRGSFPLFIEMNTAGIEPGTLLEMKLIVKDPSGFQVTSKAIQVEATSGLVGRSRLSTDVEYNGSRAGVWRVQVFAGEAILGEYPFEVRLPETTEGLSSKPEPDREAI